MIVTKILAIVERHMRQRRTRHNLVHLSDRGLSDIGVARSQIEQVARQASLSQ